MRQLLFGMIIQYSIPAIWLTINPSDLTNPLVLRIAGADFGQDDNFTNLRDRIKKEAMKDPGVIADFFNNIVQTLFSSLIRVESEKPGIFGKTVAHFGAVESTKRMMLHLHAVFWLGGNPDLPGLAKKMLENSEYRTQVLLYVDNIIRCTVDPAIGKILRTRQGHEPFRSFGRGDYSRVYRWPPRRFNLCCLSLQYAQTYCYMYEVYVKVQTYNKGTRPKL